MAGGWIRSAHCVHHIVPIETATTMEEMKRLAFCSNMSNPLDGLMSLCDECHHKIHEEMRSFDPANVKARAEARQARWADNIVNKFINNKDNDRTGTTSIDRCDQQKERAVDATDMADV